MFKILLLIIVCGLLIGAYIVKKGIGCLLALIAMIIIGVLILPFLSDTAPDSSNDSGSSTDNAVEQKNDDYSQVYFDELADELANGVDAAKSKYLDQKIVIVGNFDKMNLDENARIEGVSDDSIVISSDEDDITLLVVGRMQTDEQREEFRQFSEDDMVILRGTITDISESAFFMDIDDIG